jgi:hypothetical protein
MRRQYAWLLVVVGWVEPRETQHVQLGLTSQPTLLISSL